MKSRDEILTDERLSFVRGKRMAAREAAFSECEKIIGAEATVELRRFYDIFDEKIYVWLAGLYDRESGAFYYSNSARDTRLYLPDIESTAQVLKFLGTSGMIGSGGGGNLAKVPEFVRDGIVNFALSLQDGDGYFYHPQWGKNISVSRRGRDLSWARNILSEVHIEPKYPLPTAKGKDGRKSAFLPDYLQELGLFKKYLSEMDLSRNSYYIGNVIESTVSQISAAGIEYVEYLLSWLNSQNRADNGLWEEGVSYASVNGLMKIAGSYPHLHAALPNAISSLRSAVYAALSDEKMKFVCEVYNPWAAMVSIFKANGGLSDSEELDMLRKELIKNASAAIRKTADKVITFRKEDGSYSYFRNMSSAVSQRAPVAVPRTNEGDVNATTICVGSTIRSMSEALGIPRVPVFVPEDGEVFFELLGVSPRIEKKFDIGDVFPEKPSYEEETET